MMSINRFDPSMIQTDMSLEPIYLLARRLAFRCVLPIIVAMLLVPGAFAQNAVDLSRFNVQSCVSDEVRVATAQKYLKAVDVPQYPRQFLENLKYALKHDWLLQEDFYTVDNIQRLLGVSEVRVDCLETKQFLPSFKAYGTMYRVYTGTEVNRMIPPPTPESLDGFYNKVGGVGGGFLRHLEDGRLEGVITFHLASPMSIDFMEMTFGQLLSTPEFLASPLAKELGIFARDRHGTRYIDLSDKYAWRYVGIYYANLDSRNQQIFIASRPRKQQ